jgi:hypothetical protein
MQVWAASAGIEYALRAASKKKPPATLVAEGLCFTSPEGRGRIAKAIRVRGYDPSIDLNPSPASHLTMQGDLSLRER